MYTYMHTHRILYGARASSAFPFRYVGTAFARGTRIFGLFSLPALIVH